MENLAQSYPKAFRTTLTLAIPLADPTAGGVVPEKCFASVLCVHGPVDVVPPAG